MCGRSNKRLRWRRWEGRGCRAGLPGMELRLYIVWSRVIEGSQIRVWHDLVCMSDIATCPVESRVACPASWLWWTIG